MPAATVSESMKIPRLTLGLIATYGLNSLGTSLENSFDHLRQQERGLQKRTRRESSGQAAKQPACFRRVLEPPNIRHERNPIHVDMLARDEFHQTGAAMRVAKAALFDSAPRGLRDGVRVKNFVNRDRAGVDALGKTLSARDVAGPDARGQAVDAVIRQPHCFVISLENHDRKHRTEGFFAHYVHLMIDVCQHGWFEERSWCIGDALTASERHRASRRGFVYVSFDNP